MLLALEAEYQFDVQQLETTHVLVGRDSSCSANFLSSDIE